MHERASCAGQYARPLRAQRRRSSSPTTGAVGRSALGSIHAGCRDESGVGVVRVTARRVTGKVLLVSAAASVVLFVIAAPFGHDHHGIGLVMSDIFWPLFLISVVVFILLALLAIAQLVMARRTRRRPI